MRLDIVIAFKQILKWFYKLKGCAKLENYTVNHDLHDAIYEYDWGHLKSVICLSDRLRPYTDKFDYEECSLTFSITGEIRDTTDKRTKCKRDEDCKKKKKEKENENKKNDGESKQEDDEKKDDGEKKDEDMENNPSKNEKCDTLNFCIRMKLIFGRN